MGIKRLLINSVDIHWLSILTAWGTPGSRGRGDGLEDVRGCYLHTA